eukprot:1006119-Rhodomonas_salina.1
MTYACTPFSARFDLETQRGIDSAGGQASSSTTSGCQCTRTAESGGLWEMRTDSDSDPLSRTQAGTPRQA